MPRVLLLILDGVGCGAAPDAAAYGDEGADTLRHVLAACPDVCLPTLWALGLGQLLYGEAAPGAQCATLTPQAAGKDSTTGHWELAGAVLQKPLALFEKFPEDLVAELESACGTRFIGNYAQSGTVILEELGARHIETGLPILYTSADSVLQIAAHEETVPLSRLYEICEAARRVADRWQIGRVIARPFVGEVGAWQRTANRHDYSLEPPPNVLDALHDAAVPVIGIGKVPDLFAGRGFSQSHPTKSNAEGMARIEELWRKNAHGLFFANLVDFDTLFGHRRNAPGFAQALRECDAWLSGFLSEIAPGDCLLITADHGNDPTFRGTDHTRECVPFLLAARDDAAFPIAPRYLSDVAKILAICFKLEWNSAEFGKDSSGS